MISADTTAFIKGIERATEKVKQLLDELDETRSHRSEVNRVETIFKRYRDAYLAATTAEERAINASNLKVMFDVVKNYPNVSINETLRDECRKISQELYGQLLVG